MLHSVVLHFCAPMASRSCEVTAAAAAAGWGGAVKQWLAGSMHSGLNLQVPAAGKGCCCRHTQACWRGCTHTRAHVHTHADMRHWHLSRLHEPARANGWRHAHDWSEVTPPHTPPPDQPSTTRQSVRIGVHQLLHVWSVHSET